MTLFLLENEIITSTATPVRHGSIFERMLTQYATQYAQSYFSLAIYFFLAFALCGLLAGLAYLLSLSTAQETEKRSEYECGFAPFDSATRLPFDVHFYLVGILFLIFDVEVALLFPWVLSLRTVGWFGVYLMFAFLLSLSIGFLYEWKRGALLWPSRRDAVTTHKGSKLTAPSFDYEGDLPSSVAFYDPSSPHPMLVEGLLFTLICFVLTALAVSLDGKIREKALVYLSWEAFRIGFFLLSLTSVYQLVFFSETVYVLNNFFEVSRFSFLLKTITLLSVCFVIDYSELYLRKHSRRLLEYTSIIAFAAFFMMLLVTAANLMSMFLSLVGFSLALYVLIMFDASLAPSREAGLKYYYLSAMSSGLILYGLFLLYVVVGSGFFDALFINYSAGVAQGSLLLACVAIVITVIGLFFKLSAVPGHLWAPDVYEGSPAPVTAFFMLPVKVAVLGAFIQLFVLTLVPLSAFWQPLLAVAVAASILWGAFAAIQEKKIRRFFAYASINQMGFLLMGFATDSDAGFSAAVLYILVYAVMTSAFLLVYLTLQIVGGRYLHFLSDFRALYLTCWLLSFTIALILFSMAGIPPLGGFFVKYYVLSEAFNAGLYLQVIIGLATSLLSTYYYLRIIKVMLFESAVAATPVKFQATSDRRFHLYLLVAGLCAFTIFMPELVDYVTYLLFNEAPQDFLCGDSFAGVAEISWADVLPEVTVPPTNILMTTFFAPVAILASPK